MNRFITPFKREFWEHKGSFAWLPAVLGLLICLLMAGALVAVSSGAFDVRGNIDFNFSDTDEEMHDGYAREHEIRMIEALTRAREELVRSREALKDNVSGKRVHDIERHLADTQAKLAEKQRELAEEGIHIDLSVMMANVDEDTIRDQIAREFDREIAKLDAQLARETARSKALPPVPPIPPVPPLPGVDAQEPNTSDATGNVRKFPSQIIVIDKDEDTRQNFSEENVDDMNKVIKVFFALFSGLMIVVSVFYLLGSLFSDRKDQSILFWKSMPVSETQQVLTKLGTGLVLLPTIAVITATLVALVFQLLAMIFVGAHSPTTTAMELWSGTHPISIAFNHWFIAMGVSLWSLPFFAWLLLASAGARRSPFMLAIIPPAVIMLFEELVFDTNTILSLVVSRIPSLVIEEGAGSGFVMFERAGLTDFGNFVASPGLWMGLVISALMLAACVWLRNNRYEV